MVLGFREYFKIDREKIPTGFKEKILAKKKRHTIRTDRSKRWKEGMSIQFATGVRTKKYNCFKEGVCTGVQEIIILGKTIWVDKKKLSPQMVEFLAINDGFDSIDQFEAWFGPELFEGRLIHWENLKY